MAHSFDFDYEAEEREFQKSIEMAKKRQAAVYSRPNFLLLPPEILDELSAHAKKKSMMPKPKPSVNPMLKELISVNPSPPPLGPEGLLKSVKPTTPPRVVPPPKMWQQLQLRIPKPIKPPIKVPARNKTIKTFEHVKPTKSVYRIMMDAAHPKSKPRPRPSKRECGGP